LINALAPLHEYNYYIQKSEFILPNTLLLIHLTNSNTYTYVLQSHLDFISEDYEIVSSYDITEETNQFAFTMTDGTIGYFSLEELFDMLGLVANNITLSPTIDPFTIPLNVPTTVHEPDFHYYIYDHLGNTRIVYSTTIPNCGNPEYTLEAVMDYFPYGKILRQFIKTPEKYVTTGHERDAETGLDYRGARFYDGDVGRFLSLDPLAAEYPSLSDYCYVAGNPMMFVDTDGQRVKFSEGTRLAFKIKTRASLFLMQVAGDKELRNIANTVTSRKTANIYIEETEGPNRVQGSLGQDPLIQLNKGGRDVVFSSMSEDDGYTFTTTRFFGTLANEISHAFDYIMQGPEAYAENQQELKNPDKFVYYKLLNGRSIGTQPDEVRSNQIENKANSILGRATRIEEIHTGFSFESREDAQNFIKLLTVTQNGNIDEAKKIYRASSRDVKINYATVRIFVMWDLPDLHKIIYEEDNTRPEATPAN
jgi:RHS repeat-associated protein